MTLLKAGQVTSNDRFLLRQKAQEKKDDEFLGT